MTAIYMRKWTSVAGESATDENGVLTYIAKVWRAELNGVTRKQLAIGLAKVRQQRIEWIDLFVFADLCKDKEKLPTPEQCVTILANATYKQGSIAERYQHPLCFAIATHRQFDLFNFQRVSAQQALKMVKFVHALVIDSGFTAFDEAHYQSPLALEKLPPTQADSEARDKQVKDHLRAMKIAIGRVAAEPPKKPVMALKDAPVDDTIPKVPPMSEQTKKRLIELYGDRATVLFS